MEAKNLTEEPRPNLITRPAKGSDISFIYDTWLDSYRYGSAMGRSHKSSIFFKEYRYVLDHILHRSGSKVDIACPNGDPDTIIGFISHEPHILHFIYVKEAFQNLGIGRHLFIHAFGSTTARVTCTHLMLNFKQKLFEHPNIVHDQTILMKKGAE